MRAAHLVMAVVVLVAAISSCERTRRQREPKFISWEKAVKLIRDGKAEYVTQGHSLRVTITTKDGLEYAADEPKINDVLRVIREVDPERKKIKFERE